MTINERLRALEISIGYPVRPDIYSGPADKYVTFTYEDERATLYSDNDEEAITTYLQVSLYTPSDYNYLEDKKKIKSKLKELEFNVESIKSWIEDSMNGINRTRHTVFIINTTEEEEE